MSSFAFRWFSFWQSCMTITWGASPRARFGGKEIELTVTVLFKHDALSQAAPSSPLFPSEKVSGYTYRFFSVCSLFSLTMGRVFCCCCFYQEGQILSFYRPLLLVRSLFAKVFIRLSLWMLVPIVLTNHELIGVEMKNKDVFAEGIRITQGLKNPGRLPGQHFHSCFSLVLQHSKCAHTNACVYFWDSHYWAIYIERGYSEWFFK